MVLNKLSIVLGLILIEFALYSNPPASLAINGEADRRPLCVAKDPTGTPLNVRSKPNGRIITQVTNGTEVPRTNRRARGRWVEITIQVSDQNVTGWVIRDYLSCE